MRSYLSEYHLKNFGFRLRGTQITRVEGFSDSVFAIAITLLIFANQVPKNYALIRESMQDIIPFGLCITLLISLWYAHFGFFVRYGLEDAKTVAWNTVFLFLLLIYVFPLKFLTTFLYEVYRWLFIRWWVDPDFKSERLGEMFDYGDMPELMIFYSSGIAAIYLVLMMMYRHALALKSSLELSERELFETKMSIRNLLVMAIVPIISVAMVFIGGAQKGPMYAGFAYFLYFPFIFVNLWHTDRKRKEFISSAETLALSDQESTN
jgi:uncharacterized membrane protein